MRRNVDRRRAGARPRRATLFSRLGLWLAAIALLAQNLAVAAPLLAATSAPGADLAALVGPGVVLCAHADEPGAPGHLGDACDHCPLCRLAASGHALDLAEPPPLAAPARLVVAKLGFADSLRRAPALRLRHALARGPPSLT